ncbi:class I SAM-dependent methyltransferase [Flavobacterium sp.]|uniref:class I SAM-dependent methyltransferase n=1 Tax=Flavobacterium sp. TaxID=239 RepID=UPI0026083848|nr:class I SAM-dependent methyltransferase [Flavobacterium sp.]MDD2986639.1 class I SAM-dependent methyltransferase [Flavobacterium sp.]
MNCPLCQSPSNHFYSQNTREFYFCSTCFAVFLDNKNYFSEKEEQKHYENHNNDIFDKGYQQFASPITNAIQRDFKPQHQGLDYGSGTNSVIVKMLKDSAYHISEYDPFFSNTISLLNQQYDYISCCEVMEHFHHPKKEFEKLYNLLLPNGKLYCMTDLFDETKNFDTWYYKNDHSHVFFYHAKTIAWIAKTIGFSNYSIEGRLILFEK